MVQIFPNDDLGPALKITCLLLLPRVVARQARPPTRGYSRFDPFRVLNPHGADWRKSSDLLAVGRLVPNYMQSSDCWALREAGFRLPWIEFTFHYAGMVQIFPNEDFGSALVIDSYFIFPGLKPWAIEMFDFVHTGSQAFQGHSKSPGFSAP